jgi:hypothetical protein
VNPEEAMSDEQAPAEQVSCGHDHRHDASVSAIHMDAALNDIGRWILTNRATPEQAATRILAVRFMMADSRLDALIEAWTREAADEEHGGVV